MANHCAIVKSLCIVNLLWRRTFNTAGSIGLGRNAPCRVFCHSSEIGIGAVKTYTVPEGWGGSSPQKLTMSPRKLGVLTPKLRVLVPKLRGFL